MPDAGLGEGAIQRLGDFSGQERRSRFRQPPPLLYAYLPDFLREGVDEGERAPEIADVADMPVLDRPRHEEFALEGLCALDHDILQKTRLPC